MNRILNSFKIRSGTRILDYRLGENLDLNKIKIFFQEKDYQFKNLWYVGRHITGILTKGSTPYFLKISTSEGMSVVTKREYDWNDYFNKYFPKDFPFYVPKNFDKGSYRSKYFYIISEYFDGKLLCNTNDTFEKSNHLIQYIPKIIELSELIQKMLFVDFIGEKGKEDYRVRFINKTNSWFSDIPLAVQKKFEVKVILDIVKGWVNELTSKPRHGDFTPWHIINLKKSGLGLIDGEHALPDGVENYDICYLIQRVFSVLKNPQLAQDIYSQLLIKGYKKDKLKVVLAARAIGGFLDESLKENPDYRYANNFKDWIIES